MKMKRAMIAFGIAALVLIPVFTVGMTEEAPETSQFDVIATAADEYLNDPDTLFNIASKDMLAKMLPIIHILSVVEVLRTTPRAMSREQLTCLLAVCLRPRA